MKRVQLWGFECERCGHQWVPRDSSKEPRVCPNCKSPYWDRPRQDAKKSVAKKSPRAAKATKKRA